MTKDIQIPKAVFLKTNTIDSNRNIGLDIARVVCLIGVIFSHTNNYAGSYTNIYKLIFPFGFIIQELIFGLSGFLVGHQITRFLTTGNSFKGLITFYKKRWLRTIPFYYIFLVINYILFVTIYRHSNMMLFENTSFSLIEYFTFTQNLHSSHPYFYPEIWPIVVEEWSFLLLPIPIFLLVVNFKKAVNAKHIIIILTLGIIIITASRVYYVLYSNPELDWGLRKIVIYRLDALLYGFLVRVFIDNYKPFTKRTGLLLLIIGFCMAFGFYFFGSLLSPIIYKMLFFTIVPLGMSLSLPYFYLNDFSFLSDKLKSLLTHLSLTSYVILLSHLYFIQFLLLSFFVPKNTTESIFFTIIYFSVLIIFSTLFFNYIERPILLRRKNMANQKISYLTR